MINEKTKTEEMIWIDITPKHGIWKPTQPGDTITGTLLTTIPAPYKGRPNTKYCLQTNHPEAINQKIIIYGTYCLNKTLKDPELIGKTIKITYKGETPNQSDPMKKPFKKYKIQIQLKPQDPLYTKYTTNNNKNTSPTQANNTNNTLKQTDDTQIQQIIQQYIQIHQAEHPHTKPTPTDILKLAQTDPDLTTQELLAIKNILAKKITQKNGTKKGGK